MTSPLSFLERVVTRAGAVLDGRVSRRGFIARTTMVGTAIAATGCTVITRPGSPYTRVTDCPTRSLCRDGYTEFCCVINRGQNSCPPGTAAAGWWRADYSVYCDGTRYYIDCNDFSGHPPGCRCGDGCGTRKVYCNHFRYGQCNQWISGTGVIACRMVTCVPPYELDLGCSPSGAVDNATAGHYTDCAPYTPPPPPPPPAVEVSVGDAVSTGPDTAVVVVRDGGGGVATRVLTGASPGPWAALGGGVNSRVVVAATTPGHRSVFFRGNDLGLWTNSFDGSVWSGDTSLGGSHTSDPAVLAHATGLYAFVRGGARYVYVRRNQGAGWEPFVWVPGCVSTSDPAVCGDAGGVHLFWRGENDGAWTSTFDGSSWSGPVSLGGVLTSDLAVTAGGAGRVCVVRGGGDQLYLQRDTGGGWEGFVAVPGAQTSADPSVLTVGTTVHVFWRGLDRSAYTARLDGTSWTGPEWLGGSLTSNFAPATDGSKIWLFARGGDHALHLQHHDGSGWSGWQDQGGQVTSVRGAADR